MVTIITLLLLARLSCTADLLFSNLAVFKSDKSKAFVFPGFQKSANVAEQRSIFFQISFRGHGGDA